MEVHLVSENLNEFNFFRKSTSNKNTFHEESSEITWSHDFKNEKLIDIIKYKDVFIKLIKTGSDPEKYYAILPIEYKTVNKLMPYYSLKAALNSTKNVLDTYL